MTSLLVSVLVMMALPYVLPGIEVLSWGSALAAAIILGIVNALIRPVLQVLSLPLNILTLGLFSFVVNGAMVMLTSTVVGGFNVSGWLTAIIAAVIISCVTGTLNRKASNRIYD